MKTKDINRIKEVIPLLIVFIIIAICSGRGIELFTQNIFKWFMLVGMLTIISGILLVFDDPFAKTISKIKIGILILFIGGAGQAYFFPSPESYTPYEVTQQILHRTDFSDSMTKRLEHEKERSNSKY